MCSLIFTNATQTEGEKPEELSNLEDSDFEIIRSIVNGLRPQFTKRRTTLRPLCPDDNKTFFDKIPIDKPEDVLNAHRDIAAQFPEWLEALNSDCNVLALAGNGSKTFICNMFANFIIENTDDNVLELNPNSSSYTTNKAKNTIFSCLEEYDSALYLIIHSADLPAAQDLIYNSILPLRMTESRLKIILALDTLLIHAQIQLWGLKKDFLLKDSIHTFLDFRLELIQQWLKNKHVVRQLLGESSMTSYTSPFHVIEKAGLLKFGAEPPRKGGTESELSASAGEYALGSSDCESDSDNEDEVELEDDNSDEERQTMSENEEIPNKVVMRSQQRRPVTAPNKNSDCGVTTRSRARAAK